MEYNDGNKDTQIWVFISIVLCKMYNENNAGQTLRNKINMDLIIILVDVFLCALDGFVVAVVVVIVLVSRIAQHTC